MVSTGVSTNNCVAMTSMKLRFAIPGSCNQRRHRHRQRGDAGGHADHAKTIVVASPHDRRSPQRTRRWRKPHLTGPQNPRIIGGLLVAIGAILLAAKGLFAKALYNIGLSFHDVAAIRSVLAVPGFALLAWLYRGKTVGEWDNASRRKELLLALFAGFFCYYLGALANFYALTIIDASVERPLLFAYPIFVVIITTLITRSRPRHECSSRCC